jgi:phage tail-like protein
VLERGLAIDDLWNWALAASDGKAQRKTIRIRLQDEANEKQWAWQIEHAVPVRWAVSDLDAQTSAVVMETLELAHHGLRRAT